MRKLLLGTTVLALHLLGAGQVARADDGPADNSGLLPLPSGQFIHPTAATNAVFQKLNPGLADHPSYGATGAIATAVSPDGATLLVLTSGYNRLSDAAGASEAQASDEYVFVYDISGSNRGSPKRIQVLKAPNTFAGLAWAPGKNTFYVSGGVDEKIYQYAGSQAAGWSLVGTTSIPHPQYGLAFAKTPLAAFGAFLGNGLGLTTQAAVAGIGLSPDGTVMAAANIYNDSVTILDVGAGGAPARRVEYDLRPFNTDGASGNGKPGGNTPYAVALKDDRTVYVSALRNREVVAIDIGGAKPVLKARIPVAGNPNSMIFNADRSRLYVAQDNSDAVAAIDTATNAVLQEIDAIAPAGITVAGERYTGAATNGLALSPDGRTLYATNGGANSVAVIDLTLAAPATVGLVPTGWYPNSVSLSADGLTMYVVNGKSDPGADPLNNVDAANQYILQTEAAGLLSANVPTASDLPGLTLTVAANNFYNVAPNARDAAVMAGLRAHIRHVIYVVKENRTFDQVLGDMANGANADPSLTMYGRNITPSQHRIASQFVTLDNFFCSGEVSGNGWGWSTGAREADFEVKTIPMNYAGRGSTDDSNGLNRDTETAQGYPGRRVDYPTFPGVGNLYDVLTSALPGGPANLLAGVHNDFATDGPAGTPPEQGFLWNSVLRAGLSVRNYGFFVDLASYVLPPSLGGASLSRTPFKDGAIVAYASDPALIPVTDQYFRGFDNVYPDVWRLEEWEREFKQYVAGGNLPSLELVRLMHDHQGNFDTALGGFDTPETQVADNDLALGRLVQDVANSPYAGSTLIFVLEDDAQAGADHMDAHRSTGYVVGPYVKKHAVVSTRYTTVNMLRTIEDVLGADHLNLNDAYQAPMTDVFDLSQPAWTFNAAASSVLRSAMTSLPQDGVRFAEGSAQPAHDARWWAAQTAGFDWSAEDRAPAELFNEILWDGLKGGTPYPAARSGQMMRQASDRPQR